MLDVDSPTDVVHAVDRGARDRVFNKGDVMDRVVCLSTAAMRWIMGGKEDMLWNLKNLIGH